MSSFRFRRARGSSHRGRDDHPVLLTRVDERAARAARAIDEMSAPAPADEGRAWARIEAGLAGPHSRPGQQVRAGSWRRNVGFVAAGALVAAIAFALFWPRASTLSEQSGDLRAPPAIPPAARPPVPPVGEAPRVATADIEAPPGERPEPAPLATGVSVLSPGVRARMSRGGRATYFPATKTTTKTTTPTTTKLTTGASPYLLLEKGTVEIENGAVTRPDARAAEGPLEVRVAGWQLRGGGRFKVATHGRRVDVTVEEGEVTVWSSVRIVARVVAGERWASAPEAMATLPADTTSAAPSDASSHAASEPRDCLRLARDGVTAAAIACLESQSGDPGLTGELALLELARIRRDVKGDLAGAERLLAEHEKRFPHSGLATEARTGRIELLLRLDRPAEALAQAQHLADAEAIYWRAVSLAALGRRGEARDAFDEYLRRPDVQRRREARRARDELGP
jgi:hypothetical protein